MDELTVPATLDALEPISEFILVGALRAGLDEHAAWQVQLAVDEAATNIIQHGYDPAAPGMIELSLASDGQQFIVQMRDHGRGFRPEEVPHPDLVSPLEERQVGGLGLYLMRRLMDQVEFSFDPIHGNLLVMAKRLPPPPLPPATIIELQGRLDAGQAPNMSALIRASLHEHVQHLLLDMAKVSFLSSSGLRALLLVRKEMVARGGELRLCSLKPQVFEVFVLTGFTQVFAIHATREEALASFGRGMA